jgi:hypothetical protein
LEDDLTLNIGPSRTEPALHFLSGLVEYEKALRRILRVLQPHFGESLDARRHYHIQIPMDARLFFDGVSFLALNNPPYPVHYRSLSARFFAKHTGSRKRTRTAVKSAESDW